MLRAVQVPLVGEHVRYTWVEVLGLSHYQRPLHKGVPVSGVEELPPCGEQLVAVEGGGRGDVLVHVRQLVLSPFLNTQDAVLALQGEAVQVAHTVMLVL